MAPRRRAANKDVDLDVICPMERTKRITRLPKRFDDHSVSPSKFLPLKPISASTPIAKSKSAIASIVKPKTDTGNKTKLAKEVGVETKSCTKSPDSNNNPKTGDSIQEIQQDTRRTRNKRQNVIQGLQPTNKQNVKNEQQVNNRLNTRKIKNVMQNAINDGLVQIKPNTRSIKNKQLKSSNKSTIYNDLSSKVLEDKELSSKEEAIILTKSPSRLLNRKTTAPKRVIDKNLSFEVLENKKLSSKEKANVPSKSPSKPLDKRATAPKRIIDKDFSFKVLEDKDLSSNEKANKLDLYEFTFDPNEEPQPQKKKRKKPIKKKPPKPKTVYVTNNYKSNILKTLETLKTVVNKKQNTPAVENTQAISQKTNTNNKHPTHVTESANINEIQDISYNNDINYSPIVSPNRDNNVKLSNINETRDLIRKTRCTAFRPEPSSKDPLNLLDELNSFDEVPVACSSMNISTRLPEASPWRAEFNELPIKWPTNAYIKPNMTPAVESSYINLSNNSKRHVYTNLVPICHDELPEIVTEKEQQTNLKQSTLLDFIKETVERSTKKRNRSKTPSRKTNEDKSKTPKKLVTSRTLQTPVKDASNENIQQNSKTPVRDASNDNIQQNSNTPLYDLNSNEADKENEPHILDNTGNFFGFDDSENQENISPKKKENPRLKSLRSRSRAVLGEINKHVGPTRANLPISAKNKFAPCSDAINKMFDEIKSVSEAPAIENNPVNVETTVVEPAENIDESNEDSVHLFEDLEVLHHFHQPNRKSYGKTKKVTFQQTNIEETNDTSSSSSREKSPVDDECDLDDLEMMEMNLPFDNPTIKDKKVVKQKKGIKLTKKEEQEVEEWAAAFNSMCEDVDDFPLMVE